MPPLLPYAALEDQLDLYRVKCAEHGTTLDIVWIDARYLDEDRDTARREAERGMKRFLAGNASPLTEGDGCRRRRSSRPRATASTRPASSSSLPRRPTTR